MVLMVSVVYKKRALPLAWVVHKGKRVRIGSSHIEVSKKVKLLIPEGTDRISVGEIFS
jgi:hypothetical protein